MERETPKQFETPEHWRTMLISGIDGDTMLALAEETTSLKAACGGQVSYDESKGEVRISNPSQVDQAWFSKEVDRLRQNHPTLAITFS